MSDALLFACKVCGRVYAATHRPAREELPEECECGGVGNDDVDPYFPIGGVSR